MSTGVGMTRDRRPTMRLAATSPTALANLLAATGMLVCGLLLHSLGSDHSSHRPFFQIAEQISRGGLSAAAISLWPYVFALCTLGMTIVLVLVRPSWYDRALLMLPICFAICLLVGWSIVLFSDAEKSRTAMLIAAIVAPLGALVSLRMRWLYLAGDVTSAAAWGQGFLCVLAIFSLRWFWFPPVSQMLLGGWLSIISSMLMMFAAWTWITRAKHDLRASDCPPLRFQISLKQIVIAVAFTAIALSYWRYLEVSTIHGPAKEVIVAPSS